MSNSATEKGLFMLIFTMVMMKKVCMTRKQIVPQWLWRLQRSISLFWFFGLGVSMRKLSTSIWVSVFSVTIGVLMV